MRLATRMVSTWSVTALVIGSNFLDARADAAVPQVQQALPVRRAAYAVQPTGSALAVKWIGQDGHDYVGPNNALQPSEVQDIHLVLGGLDPQREVTFVDVKAEPNEQWQYNCAVLRLEGRAQADQGLALGRPLPRAGKVEAPRNYHILVRYDNGATAEADIRGRKVSRSLRMPGAALLARWVGQEKQDHVNAGPSVGPDGVADVRIRLSAVSTKLPVKAIRIEGPGGMKWESGSNPDLLPGAEYRADPRKPGEGDLFFQPDRDLKGQRLKVLVLYANDILDSATLAAGRVDPKLRMPESPLPRISELAATARWLGQDGQDVTGSGDVHVHLSGLSRTPSIAAAVLTDSVHGSWVYHANERVKPIVPQGGLMGTLAIRPGSARGSLDLFFAPYRDESRTTLTLRLIDLEGRSAVVRFEGGSCDPGRCVPRPGETRIEARPGDDLNALVNQYGTVSLAEGTYRLPRPLVLNRPVTLTAEGKATLVFTQAASDTLWTAAIKIHCGNTTCNGFAVRFEGPIRWDQDVSYGPAVIGTTDNKDQGHPELKYNIVLTRLDLEIPPAANPSKWIEALRLMRLTNARSGMIAGNILHGGSIEFFEGPWHLLNNDFRGTPPGTISHAVFTGHRTYDLRIRGNRAKPVQPDGKTWRFLVLTHDGLGDHVEENIVEGLGFRDDDTIPPSNEPEVLLTEGYHVGYEGRVAALSQDGRVLRIYRAQGEQPAIGNAVSLLTGPAAGQFRRIAQVIDPETYLVDAPIPKGTDVVSASRAFIGEVFQKNRIDMRVGQKSGGLILIGNHFGTRVIGNHILGGANAIRFAACPTETPVTWGWSHAPFLGAVIEDNTFEDAAGGSILGVEHSARDIKSNKGRTYMSIALNRNVVRWTEAFLQRYSSSGARSLPPGLILGHLPSHDADEFLVRADGNRLEAPAGLKAPESLLIYAARFNSQKLVNRKFSLPMAAIGSASATRPAAGSSSDSFRR